MMVTLAHEPRQAMWTGCDTAEKFSHATGGLWLLASVEDRQQVDSFHDSLYAKYGRGELGWYHSLDNHTGDPRKSLALYFKEMRSFFRDVRPVPSILPR